MLKKVKRKNNKFPYLCKKLSLRNLSNKSVSPLDLCFEIKILLPLLGEACKGVLRTLANLPQEKAHSVLRKSITV